MLQAGWGMTPQVIVEKQKRYFTLDEIDLTTFFNNKDPHEAIKELKQIVDTQTNTLLGISCGNFLFSPRTSTDDWGNDTVESLELQCWRWETDEELEQRKSKLVNDFARKEAQERYTYEQLKKKFEGETNAK